jgi:hypothetical protein
MDTEVAKKGPLTYYRWYVSSLLLQTCAIPCHHRGLGIVCLVRMERSDIIQQRVKNADILNSGRQGIEAPSTGGGHCVQESYIPDGNPSQWATMAQSREGSATYAKVFPGCADLACIHPKDCRTLESQDSVDFLVSEPL